MRKRGGEAEAELPLNEVISSSPAYVRFPCSESPLAWDQRTLKGASCAFGSTERTLGRGKNEVRVHAVAVRPFPNSPATSSSMAGRKLWG